MKRSPTHPLAGESYNLPLEKTKMGKRGGETLNPQEQSLGPGPHFSLSRNLSAFITFKQGLRGRHILKMHGAVHPLL